MCALEWHTPTVWPFGDFPGPVKARSWTTMESNYRAYADNVILRFIPRSTTALGGLIHLPQQVTESRVGTREAEVMGVGTGHWMRSGKFKPTEVQVGQRVLVDALAGQNYDLDLTVPRHNKPAEWGDERGEFRVVREDEILGIVEHDDATAAE